MSRLDYHVASVRNRLMLGLFLQAWAWTAFYLGLIIWLTIVGERLMDRTINHPAMLLWLGLAASALGAWVWTLMRMPTRQAAAVAIDQAFGLKEKFSSALFVRELDDPFARAVVLDAEIAADRVSLAGRFRPGVPRHATWTGLAFLAALLTALLMPAWHAQGKSSTASAQTRPAGSVDATRKQLAQELPSIEEGSKLLAGNDAIQKANEDFKKSLQSKDGDDPTLRRDALSAMEQYRQAVKDELAKNEEFQTSLQDKLQLSSIAAAKDDSTPIGKAQNELRNGNVQGAMTDLDKAVKDFQSLTPDEQQKTVQQAKDLANALADAAHDPRTTERMAQQLMQAGATQAQAQQMAAAMQQSANGDKNAQQQLQQMTQQMSQQMNNGQGPTPQQQQQIQSLMAQAQAIANSQARAQTLSSSAQKMAQAMSQAQQAQAQAQANQQSQPGQQPGSQQGNQPGQQQASSQQPGQQPGQQPNGQQGNQQAMSQAQQAMQQQLAQMQASAQDAQAMQQAADAAAQAAADAADGLPSGDGSSETASSQSQSNPSPSQNNGPNQGGANQVGPGGAKMPIAYAPFKMKQEVDPSQLNDSGKILASRLVKAGIDPGTSSAAVRDAVAANNQDAPDEVDDDHVPRESQQAEKDYFTNFPGE